MVLVVVQILLFSWVMTLFSRQDDTLGGRSSFLYKGNAGFFPSCHARLTTLPDYFILEYLRRIIVFLIRGAPGWLVGATLGGKENEVNTSMSIL